MYYISTLGVIVIISRLEYKNLVKKQTTLKKGHLKMIISKKKYDELLELAYHDSLTGCYNRNWFERVFLQNNLTKYVNLAIIDINNLKGINDSCGHNAGDQLIKQVTEALSEYSTVVRWGGDEFFCIIEQPSLYNFEKLCKRQGDFAYAIERNVDVNNLQNAIYKLDNQMYNCKTRQKRIYPQYLDASVTAFIESKEDEDELDSDAMWL